MEKACFKCGEVKPMAEFYTHPQMADGHLNKCKACTRRDNTAHRNKHLDRFQEYDRKRGRAPERRERERERWAKLRAANPDHVRELRKRAGDKWEASNPHKKRAHGIVARALRTGHLTRQPCCVCGSERSQAHHDDYSKPLDVMWLCPLHHGDRHAQLRDAQREAAKAS